MQFIVSSGDLSNDVLSTDNKSAAISFLNTNKNKSLGLLVCVDDGIEPVYFSTESLRNESQLRVV
jgi:hypothetical protein